MIGQLLVTLKQWSCPHGNVAKKRKPIAETDMYLLYTECLDCGKESEGIETGGYHYGGKNAA